MAGSEISDRHADSALTYEPAAGQRICLRPNTEPILRNPTSWVERNFKKPIWFTHCRLTRASLYPHKLQKLKWCFRTAETHKRYDYNSSHVQPQSFAIEQWQSAVNQVQSSQRWVEPNQCSVPKHLKLSQGTTYPVEGLPRWTGPTHHRHLCCCAIKIQKCIKHLS